LGDNLRYKLSLTLDCLWPHIRWFVSQSGPVWRFNWRTLATSGELAKERRDRPIVLACLIALTVFFVVLFGDFSGEDYFALPKTALQLVAFIPLAVTAGFCEEVVFRGYLLKQFERLTSSTNAAIIVQAIVFSLVPGYHQTMVGFVHKFCFGLAFGALAIWRKSLVPGIMAHILLDLSGAVTAFFV
jgi:membrane protease YdiL (CAAX protease family)